LTVWIMINYGPRGVVYHSLYLIYYVYSRCYSRAIGYFNTFMYHNDKDKWGLGNITFFTADFIVLIQANADKLEVSFCRPHETRKIYH